jgi:glycosyltransferase involved in cell wall biosynthesis
MEPLSRPSLSSLPHSFPLPEPALATAVATPTVSPAVRVLVSVIIPTLNEEHQIGEAVEALWWADEVIVVDGGSDDDTTCIAESHGATILHLPGATIGGQRNAGIDAARNEWILALDADERVGAELIGELLRVTECVAHDAYRIRFRNFYGRRELTRGRWANDAHIRLFRRRYRFTGHRVHEHLETVSSVGDLDGRILHTPYRDLDQHLRKIVKYARLGAEDLHARGRKARLWELVMRPGWRFLRDYVGYGSYREGLFGLITSSLSALAAFLKYAFLYMLERGA